MTHRLFLLICAISLFSLGLASGALADNSHARIVRLSLDRILVDVWFPSLKLDARRIKHLTTDGTR